jgi:cytochrome c-type biogenesis protein CcmE
MRWLVLALAVACNGSGSSPPSSQVERRYDDLGEIKPGKASVIGTVQAGSVIRSQAQLRLVLERAGKRVQVTAPLPAPDLLRDGATVLARGRITDELVLDASELRVLICGSAPDLDDPLCPK